MRTILVIAVVALGAAGCAHDVHARYPAAPGAPTGTLVLLLSSPARGVSVAIDGRLVVEGAHTERIVVDNVPTGTEEIVMTANGADKAMRVWVSSEHPTTVPLGAPEAPGGLLTTLLGTLLSITAYVLLR